MIFFCPVTDRLVTLVSLGKFLFYIGTLKTEEVILSMKLEWILLSKHLELNLTAESFR